MIRVQFFPSQQLYNLLSQEAAKNGVSKSQVVITILEQYYKLSNPQKPTVIQLTNTVLSEIHDYVHSPSSPRFFSLYSASATFRSIEMTDGKRPATIRASIGRSFKSKIGKPPFLNVRKHVINGRQQLSENNAIMYEIIYNK